MRLEHRNLRKVEDAQESKNEIATNVKTRNSKSAAVKMEPITEDDDSKSSKENRDQGEVNGPKGKVCSNDFSYQYASVDFVWVNKYHMINML